MAARDAAVGVAGLPILFSGDIERAYSMTLSAMTHEEPSGKGTHQRVEQDAPVALSPLPVPVFESVRCLLARAFPRVL